MKKIFIGSSTESKKKANVLKGILENYNGLPIKRPVID